MDPARRVGEVLAGKYRLERLLGVGGMGAVYEAVHLGVEKRFAVKVLKSDVARAPDSVTRFTQEARAAARIGHPNLVEVFDMGETEEGTLYMVMELLTGRSLFEALRNGPLTPDEALTIAEGTDSARKQALHSESLALRKQAQVLKIRVDRTKSENVLKSARKTISYWAPRAHLRRKRIQQGPV